jgi:hypothetical protein
MDVGPNGAAAGLLLWTKRSSGGRNAPDRMVARSPRESPTFVASR